MIGHDGCITANTPEFTLDTLTDVQLREYRRELEHSLKVIAPAAPVRGLLTRKLLEVLGEQAARSTPGSGASERPDSERQDDSELSEEIVSKS